MNTAFSILSRVFRVILIILVAGVVFVFFLAAAYIYIPFFNEKLIPRLIHRANSDIRIEKFDIGSQGITFPLNFKFTEVNGELIYREERFSFAFKDMDISGSTHVSSGLSSMAVNFSGLTVDSDLFEAGPVDAKLNVLIFEDAFKGVEGDVAVKRFASHNVEGKDITAFVFLNQQIFELDDIEGKVYGGELSGNVLVNLDAPLHYSAKLNVSALSTQEMGKQMRFVSSNIDGEFDIDIRAEGNPDELLESRTRITARETVDVNPLFLYHYITYVWENFVQMDLGIVKEQLQGLRARAADVPVERLKITINSKGADAAEIRTQLASRQVNLDIDYFYDINVEGGLLSLLEHFDTIIKIYKEGG